ncbi:MAG: DMT family transporter [Myxococcales bacterium]|nr:DMT family transporter [Myxococcales bacterium]
MAEAAGGDARVAMAVGAAVVAISTAAPVIRLAAPFGPEAVACLRLTVTTLGLALLAAPATVRALRLLAGSPREAKLTLLAGLCLAAHFGAWISSLWLTSVVRSVALVTTTPLWAALLARVLGDAAPRRVYLGTAVAVAGTVIMVAEPGALSGGGSWVGDLLALSGAVTAAVYLSIGRHVHGRLGDALPVEGYFVSVNLVACVALWAFALIRGADLSPLGVGTNDFLAILWLGLVPGIVGHGLLNWAVRRLPVHTVAVATLLEPVGAAAIAWALLGEAVAGREAVGALVLLGGVALGLPRSER